MVKFKDEIDKERGNLETQNLDAQSTQEAVKFITKLQELKRKVNKWTTDVENFLSGEKVLRQQRYVVALAACELNVALADASNARAPCPPHLLRAMPWTQFNQLTTT
jgi:hypothetical protein